MDIYKILNLSISWGPTIIFALIVLVSYLKGLRRGLRKSAIFLLHAIIAFAICVVLYCILTERKGFDGLLLRTINGIMGSNTALQDALSVSKDCASVKEVLVEAIPPLLGADSLSVILSDSGAYLTTLVMAVYNVVLIVVLWVVYVLLKGIFFIFFLLFNSDRRHKKRIAKKIKAGKDVKPFKKRRLAGSMVGLARGLIAGFLVMSFLGGIFYVTTGGTGKGTLNDFTFNDENADNAYSYYQCLDRYGTTGIYKVLNAVKDKNDMPFYLFAADLVFSSEFEDVENNETRRVRFLNDFGTYVNFAKETVNLLLKYGGKDIRDAILNDGDKDTTDVVVETLGIPEFQTEFKEVIRQNDFTDTFIFDFGFSLLDSIAANIDEVGFADSLEEDSRDLVKVLFKKGYYSEKIPSEKQAIESGETDEVLPYLNATNIVSKSDIITAIDIALAIINTDNSETSDKIDAAVEYIDDLTLFKESNKARVNPVLSRLYNFAEQTFLSSEDDSYVVANYDNNSIDWIQEIKDLSEVAGKTFKLIDNVTSIEEATAWDICSSIFDKGSEDYQENHALYQDVKDLLVKSKMVGRVMLSPIMYTTVKEVFTGISDNFEMPKNLTYADEYEGGVLSKKGELTSLFDAFERLFEDDKIDTTRKLLNNEVDFANDFGTLKEFIIGTGDNDNIVNILLESDIMHSFISAEIIGLEEGEEGTFVVPYNTLEKDEDGEYLPIIKKEVLNDLFNKFKYIEVTSFDGDSVGDSLKSIAKNKDSIFGNFILDATLSHLIIQNAGTDVLSMPSDLSADGEYNNLKNYTETNKWHGELPNLVGALDEFFDLSDENSDFELTDSYINDNVKDKVAGLNANIKDSTTTTKLDVLYRSEIIKATLTDTLEDNASGTIIENSLPNIKDSDGNLEKSEVSAMVATLEVLEISGFNMDNLSDTISGKVKGLNREIKAEDYEGRYVGKTKLDVLYGSIVIVDAITDTMDDKLADSVPQEVIADTKDEGGKLNKAEMYSFVGIMEIYNVDFSNFSGTGFATDVIDDFANFNKEITAEEYEGRYVGQSKLGVMYSSTIVKYYITDEMQGKVNSNAFMQDHPSAYDGKYYKQTEIESLVNIIGTASLDTLSVDELLNIDQVLAYYSDESGAYKANTNFYILSSCISVNVLDNDVLTVPKGSVEDITGYRILTDKGIYDLLNAIKSFGVSSIAGMDASLLKIDGNADKVSVSDIMRATITCQLNLNGSSLYAVKNIDVSKVSAIYKDNGNYSEKDIYLLSQTEFTCVLNAVSTLTNTSSVNDISFDISTLTGLNQNDLNTLLASNVMRFEISGILSEYLTGYPAISSILSGSGIKTTPETNYTVNRINAISGIIDVSDYSKQFFTETEINGIIDGLKIM